ncbi:unnamed protein product, partial [Staurois parvus]
MVFPPPPCQNTRPAVQLCSRTLPVPRSSAAQSSRAGFFSVGSQLNSWVFSALSAVSGHLLYCLPSLVIPCIIRSLLVIPCTVCSLWSSSVLSAVSWSSPVLSAVSGHPLYYLQSLVIPCTVRSLWSSPVLSAVSGHPLYCPQSLVISCTRSLCVRSLWSSPVLCPHSLVISCTVSAISGHILYCVCNLWSSP